MEKNLKAVSSTRDGHEGGGGAWSQCRTFLISETCYRYSPTLSTEDKEIADWLERLTANKPTWGFGLWFLYLRNVQGYGWNHKRVYCELELNLRIKPKKRLKRDKPEPLAG